MSKAKRKKDKKARATDKKKRRVKRKEEAKFEQQLPSEPESVRITRCFAGFP